MEFSTSDWIAMAAIAATVIVGVVSWFVSAALTRKSIEKRVLGYRMDSTPLMTTSLQTAGLKIEFDGEELPEPMLLTVEIFNLGNVALENPPISIATSKDATYIIPVQIEDIEPGYEDLWEIERTDADECEIRLAHINPGQVVKATILMDEVPAEMPHFRCPLPNVVVKEVNPVDMTKVSVGLANVSVSIMLNALGVRR
ncbi:hypothetical protein [Ruegeria arenilitoris]|uniref:hypothetical protein n=1 Tax=Ruegeria arenilitoris TaxID=1173585 RepID=UPI00147B4178|nr:hypothetical protein [Ruegeria arenilitoris]